MSVLEQLMLKSTSNAAGAGHGAWVEMMIDPIEGPAACYPDDWPHPTQPMKLKMCVDVVSDAAGYAALGVGYSLANALRTFTVTSGNFITTSPAVTSHPDTTTFAAAFTRSRFLCSGLRFVPSNTPEKSAGLVSFLPVPEENIGNLHTVSITSLMAEGVATPVNEERVEHRYCFALPTFLTTHTQSEYSPTMLVLAKGMTASTNVGTLEIYWNMEGVSAPTSVYAGVSKVTLYDPAQITIGTHVAQGIQNPRPTPQRGPRRLSAVGRQIADASAASIGAYFGPGYGSLISATPQLVREARSALKKKKKKAKKLTP